MRLFRFAPAALALACCWVTWGGVSTKRDPKASPIGRVCILPVDAELNRLGMKGGEPLVQESEEWGGKLAGLLKNTVNASGAQVTEIVSSEALANSETLRQSVLRIKQKYATLSPQMRKKFGDVAKGRYTLGDEMALLPCAAQADSVVFTRAAGLLQTDGRKAFSLLVGGPAAAVLAQGRYDIWIGFVEANRGEVTALTHIDWLGGRFAKDPDAALGKRLTEEFKKLGPIAGPR